MRTGVLWRRGTGVVLGGEIGAGAARLGSHVLIGATNLDPARGIGVVLAAEIEIAAEAYVLVAAARGALVAVVVVGQVDEAGTA